MINLNSAAQPLVNNNKNNERAVKCKHPTVPHDVPVSRSASLASSRHHVTTQSSSHERATSKLLEEEPMRSTRTLKLEGQRLAQGHVDSEETTSADPMSPPMGTFHQDPPETGSDLMCFSNFDLQKFSKPQRLTASLRVDSVHIHPSQRELIFTVQLFILPLHANLVSSSNPTSDSTLAMIISTSARQIPRLLWLLRFPLPHVSLIILQADVHPAGEIAEV